MRKVGFGLFAALLLAGVAVFFYAKKEPIPQSDAGLLAAAQKNDFEQVKSALEKGANVNAAVKSSQLEHWKGNVSPYEGNTALHFLVEHGNVEAVRYLLDKGANIDSANQFGNTPLMLSASHSLRELTRLLLDRKANVALKNRWGSTARQFAAKRFPTNESRAVERMLAEAQGEAPPPPRTETPEQERRRRQQSDM